MNQLKPQSSLVVAGLIVSFVLSVLVVALSMNAVETNRQKQLAQTLSQHLSTQLVLPLSAGDSVSAALLINNYRLLPGIESLSLLSADQQPIAQSGQILGAQNGLETKIIDQGNLLGVLTIYPGTGAEHPVLKALVVPVVALLLIHLLLAAVFNRATRAARHVQQHKGAAYPEHAPAGFQPNEPAYSQVKAFETPAVSSAAATVPADATDSTEQLELRVMFIDEHQLLQTLSKPLKQDFIDKNLSIMRSSVGALERFGACSPEVMFHIKASASSGVSVTLEATGANPAETHLNLCNAACLLGSLFLGVYEPHYHSQRSLRAFSLPCQLVVGKDNLGELEDVSSRMAEAFSQLLQTTELEPSRLVVSSRPLARLSFGQQPPLLITGVKSSLDELMESMKTNVASLERIFM